MSDGTHIEWTDATVNAINGCTVLSPGCTNCYAMRLAGTRLRDHPTRTGLTNDSKAGPVWNGTVRLNESALLQPLRWKRPRRIFWNAHGDMFHPSAPTAWIDECFAVMALTPHHIHQVLTKRSDRMRQYCSDPYLAGRLARIIVDWLILNAIQWREPWPVQSIGDPEDPSDITVSLPLPNVWLGVSVEDQRRADERIPDLLATPAAIRWLSCEPLLGPIDLTSIKAPREPDEPDLDTDWRFDALTTGDYYWFDGEHGQPGDCGDGPYREHRIDWVVAGGESGPGARPMHHTWARALRDQCAKATLDGDDAPVPFFFKQWGDWAPICVMSEEQTDACYYPSPARHPEASRRLKVKQCVMHSDGTRFDGEAMNRRPAFEQGSHAMTMMAIGKKNAGRLLDGIQHDGMPK